MESSTRNSSTPKMGEGDQKLKVILNYAEKHVIVRPRDRV